MPALLIGQIAERVGLPTATIRYYESVGLLRPAERSASGYRRYSEETVTELEFIKKAQAFGFSLAEVGEILSISRSGQAPCANVLALAHKQLALLDERLRQIQAFRDQLASQVAKWEERRTAVNCDGLCEFIMEALPVRREESIVGSPLPRPKSRRSS